VSEELTAAVELTPEQTLIMAAIQEQAASFAALLKRAEGAGVPQQVLLPELIRIMQEADLLPPGFSGLASLPLVGRLFGA
jgi:hypothetical protein